MALVWTDALHDIDWNEVAHLLRTAPLADKEPDKLQMAFTNSVFRRFVFDGARLVGAGRALADGVDCSYICDVAVLPSHQGRGIGHEIVSQLVALSRGHRKILLYAVPGKEDFYRKFGFRRMKTAMAVFDDPEAAAERGYLDQE
ncbi:MAG: GNAT family N-acetyltransferase [Stenotrophomonas maltophilia]